MYNKLKSKQGRFIKKEEGKREREREKHKEGLRRPSMVRHTEKVKRMGGTDFKGSANRFNLNNSLGQCRREV